MRRNRGPWGTVFGTLWTSREASVACRSLGFSSSVLSPEVTKAFGSGTGPVHVWRGLCSGNETSFLDCKRMSWGNVSEQISDKHCCDVGLYCLPRKFKLI